MCSGNVVDKVKEAAVTWSTGGINKAAKKAKDAATPEPPDMPEPPEPPKAAEVPSQPQQEARDAIAEDKRRRLAGAGRGSTLLTGSRGLSSGPQLGRSTLLGQ
jgi:hypothetical protein